MGQPEEIRLGVLILQDAPVEELAVRWRLAEDLGFDAAYVADHTADYRNLGGYWLDGWAVLAHMASHTERIRIGTLVANPLLHHPVQLAKQAATVDQMSGGRLELGIGTGIAGFDHAAVGQPYWDPAERAARFAEYVEVVDGVLRSDGQFEHAGQWFRTDGTPMRPGPRQRPRPPITLGGQSPTVLRTVARLGDCWNTHGPFGAGVDDIVEITARQSRALDELCLAHGRKPSDVRRSLLLFDALDPWSAPDELDKVVHRFGEIGIREFVVFWPPPAMIRAMERAVARLRS